MAEQTEGVMITCDEQMMEYIKYLNDGKDGDLCGFIVEQLDKNRVFVVKGQEDRIMRAIEKHQEKNIFKEDNDKMKK
eukprot:g4354.t1